MKFCSFILCFILVRNVSGYCYDRYEREPESWDVEVDLWEPEDDYPVDDYSVYEPHINVYQKSRSRSRPRHRSRSRSPRCKRQIEAPPTVQPEEISKISLNDLIEKTQESINCARETFNSSDEFRHNLLTYAQPQNLERIETLLSLLSNQSGQEDFYRDVLNEKIDLLNREFTFFESIFSGQAKGNVSYDLHLLNATAEELIKLAKGRSWGENQDQVSLLVEELPERLEELSGSWWFENLSTALFRRLRQFNETLVSHYAESSMASTEAAPSKLRLQQKRGHFWFVDSLSRAHDSLEHINQTRKQANKYQLELLQKVPEWRRLAEVTEQLRNAPFDKIDSLIMICFELSTSIEAELNFYDAVFGDFDKDEDVDKGNFREIQFQLAKVAKKMLDYANRKDHSPNPELTESLERFIEQSKTETTWQSKEMKDFFQDLQKANVGIALLRVSGAPPRPVESLDETLDRATLQMIRIKRIMKNADTFQKDLLALEVHQSYLEALLPHLREAGSETSEETESLVSQTNWVIALLHKKASFYEQLNWGPVGGIRYGEAWRYDQSLLRLEAEKLVKEAKDEKEIGMANVNQEQVDQLCEEIERTFWELSEEEWLPSVNRDLFDRCQRLSELIAFYPDKDLSFKWN